MNADRNSTSVLIISHGSPREQANEVFAQLVDQVAQLAARDVRRIVLMPYFLHNGQHVTRDIPAQVEKCREQHPGIEIEVMPTLHGEPMIEDLLVERLMGGLSSAENLPSDGKEIEKQSHSFVDLRLEREEFGPSARAVVRRVIHATADFSFATTMRIHPDAIERGTNAINAARPIICDVTMLTAGITRARCETLCAIGDPDVAEKAKAAGCTRSAAAMEKLADHLGGAIVAIGNAPTALWKVMEIAAGGGPRPALVVGVPVGFVGARESKAALLESDLCYITNVGNRGGSAAAAAIVNALASLD